MDSPFFRSHSRYSPSYGGFPIHHHTVQPKPVAARSSPKVVRIPVHFVSSKPEPPTRSSSALKIQKVFRGFLVRRSVKKIQSLRRETEEIERRISPELIQTDKRERLRVIESLMALLFKLDSVRGVDPAVRDFRKSVIRKVVSLQEKIDSLASAADNFQVVEPQNHHETEEPEIFSGDGGSDAIADGIGGDADAKPNDLINGLESSASTDERTDNHTLEESSSEYDDSRNGSSEQRSNEGTIEAADKVTHVSPVAEKEKSEMITAGGEESETKNEPIIDGGCEGDSEAKASGGCQIAEETDTANDGEECAEEIAETNAIETGGGECEGGEEEEEKEENGTEEDNKRNRELLERMVEDSEKMMKMMKELFERNELQTRMLNCLSHRVEQLEKAFLCDRLRRKKHKRHSC